ncbi:MlaD family protein [Paraconexibacter antarcticus]|uniref:MlaD family protein n=1 Tax=Paraconexibacter antarcticus TaxID=2949664 RepID=A0ABY5DXE0_9ACTN|nr:MlaD family protein [Paraconexibacter antarcticus]UTI66175.1 MlaD family protein [Paraconexibacter antarcticus]
MPFNRDRIRLELKRARTPLLLLAIAFVLTAVAAVGLFRNLTFQKPWEQTYTVRAAFTDAKGVSPGKNQVRLAGIKIGVVTKAVLRGDQAVLTLSIDKKHGPLYRNAKLRLRPVSPLDDKYVEVENRGTPASGRLTGETVLPASSTASPVDISRVLEVFNVPTRQSMAQLIDELGRGLPDNGHQLRAALAEFTPFFGALQRLTEITADRHVQLKRLVHNTGILGRELARRDEQVSGVISHGNAVLTELAHRDRPLDQTIRALPSTINALQRATGSLEQARNHLDPALRALVPPADDLKPALDALIKLSDSGTPALHALANPVRRLSAVAKILPATARDVTGAVKVLRRETPSLDHSTAKLPPCFVPIENFFANSMSLAKFYDGYRVVARATAGEGLFAIGTSVNEPGWKKLGPCYGKVAAGGTK